MIPLLIIGLAWLSVAAVLSVLIGRAIRYADRQDEKRAEQEWAARHAGSPGPFRGGRTRATIWVPYPDELLRPPGISRAGGRSPLLLPQEGGDDVPPDMPRPGAATDRSP
jgi:hypothetical protein